MTLNVIIKDRLGKQLFKMLSDIEGAWMKGLLLSAGDLFDLVAAAPVLDEGAAADPLKVLAIVLAAIPDKSLPILAVAVSQKDGGLIVWGDKLQSVEMADGNYRFALFGEPLPEAVKVAIAIEQIGPVGQKYNRPKAFLYVQATNSKGKAIQVELPTAIAGVIPSGDGGYAQWAADACKTYMADQDENDLLVAGLIRVWQAPELGQGGGPKTSLYQLAQSIDVSQQPVVYRVVEANLGWLLDKTTKQPRTDSKGNGIPTISIRLEDPTGGAPAIETWPEVAYDWRREISKGGYGWSDSYLDWIEIEKPVYLLIVGLKMQMRWDSAAKEDRPVLDRDGQPRHIANMGFRTTPWSASTAIAPTPTRSALPAEPIDERSADSDLFDAAGLPF